MTRAAEIVQALIARAPPRPPVERSTGMPYGWALWLRAQPQPQPRERPHASPGALAAMIAQRPPSPARGEELETWRAFFSLFRQDWLPPPRDELPLRVGSRIGSLVLHLLFIAFLVWVAWMQSLVLPPPPDAGGGGERIQVGFVGAGDPGTPQADAESPPSEAPAGEPAAPAPPAPVIAEEGSGAELPELPPLPQVELAPVAPAPAPAPPLPEVAVREVPEPVQPPQPPVEQPAQVTEVAQPTIDYVLPPTTPREIQVAPTPVEPRLREREVVLVQAPRVAAPQARPVDVPLRQPREVELRTREIDEPLPDVQVAPVAVRAPQVVPRLPGAPQASVRQREVATPSPPSPAPPGAPAVAPPSTGPGGATPSAAPSATPSSGQAATPSATAGSTPGPAPTATPGVPGGTTAARPGTSSGWESPRAGDDWGQASSGEQRPGGATPGLFDAQGRVRLPGDGSGTGPGAGPGASAAEPGQGVAERGAPGGDSDSWTRARLAESGTWLKRPPYDYEPTTFDRYWVPNESLLAEWVRKGMKSVAIPIPGTSKKIDCVISLLQLGGGCGISDPDLNEQPTGGRPPPDVPFKPELQEDNGSIRP